MATIGTHARQAKLDIQATLEEGGLSADQVRVLKRAKQQAEAIEDHVAVVRSKLNEGVYLLGEKFS